MPNTFANLVLFGYPLVVIILFRRMSLQSALIWSIVAGYLLLPMRTGIDLPMFPTIDKTFVPSVTAAIACMFIVMSQRTPLRAAAQPAERPFAFDPQRGKLLFWGLTILLFATPLITVMTNGDPVEQGNKFIRGLRMYDTFSIIGAMMVTMLPFYLGRRFLNTDDGHRLLLRVLVLAALGYSLFVLWEVRMSPFVNKHVYGFFQHSIAQHARGGGWRPKVFLNHGLWLGIFECMAVLAAMALWRARRDKEPALRWLLFGAYLFGVLVLSKTLGAFLLAVMFAPVILFIGVRGQLLIAAVIAGTVMTYPMLRGAGLVPTNKLYNFAASIDAQRAQSLQYRFDNEELLLERANKKPLAGWGSWGRPRVSNEKGNTISTSDGYWVIIIGVHGWLGYIAQFALLGLPMILMALNRRKLGVTMETAGLSIVLAAAMLDLVPNATITSVTWLVAGAVFGRYQTAVAVAPEPLVRPRMAQSRQAATPAAPTPAAPRDRAPSTPPKVVHHRRPRRAGQHG
ncbi:hypothetical protein [Actibacterium sp. XHP0104]|uniref:hypothetical protein n=1 Tax=Actibacterium sp. XHP0104 TaxID=2984335 RepID=UPI0021E9AC70|nr:hypothetical protein [Actibacterium sp. XHP0104]MCV2881872.1 hypothetical protein [Actibacterium sp. XHP0104]